MRPSLKQHVGLLPDDVSRGPKLSKSLSCVASLDSAQPLSSYHIDALASRLSPDTKDICRDKTTTVPKVRHLRDLHTFSSVMSHELSIQLSVEGELRRHDGVMTVMMKLPAQGFA